MKISGKHILMALLLAVVTLTGCRNELCYNHFPTLAMELDWEQEWERDFGMAHKANWDEAEHGFSYDFLRPERPKWVNLVKYGADNLPEEEYFEPGGGTMILENHQRSVLLYNGDTEYIVLYDVASLNEARASATLRSRASLSYVMQRHPESRSTNPPDVLFSAFVENLPKVALHETKLMPVMMQPLVYTYVVRYEFDHGIEHVALARGALGGMAESVYLRDGSTSSSTSIVLYDCDITDYGCVAHVRTFGVPGLKDPNYGTLTPAAVDNPFTLNLEVRLKNGKILEFNYDIADQMANQPRGGVIRVSNISISDDDSKSESGFDVEVSDWGSHVDIDLPI